MTTIASAPFGRQRKVKTYGKSSRKKEYDFASLEEPRDSSEIHAQLPERIPEAYRLQSSTSANHKLKSVKTKTSRQNCLNVPRSDNEEAHGLRRGSPSRPAPSLKRPLGVDDIEPDHEPSLASWERKRLRMKSTLWEHGNETILQDSSTSDRQRTENLPALGPGGSVPCPTPVAPTHRIATSTSQLSQASQSAPTGAVAKLAARRRITGSKALPGADVVIESSTTLSRKIERPRRDHDLAGNTASPRSHLIGDVVMAEVSSTRDSHFRRPKPSKTKAISSDVYDFPDTDVDVDTSDVPAVTSQLYAAHSKRGKLAHCCKPKIVASASAPARLAEMLPSDIETPEPTSRSPSVFTDRAENTETIEGGGCRESSNAARVVREPVPDMAVPLGAMTPRQAKIWKNLDILTREDMASSPSALPLQDLAIGARRRPPSPGTQCMRGLGKSKSDLPYRRRTRLVDRLKASLPNSSESEHISSNSSSEEELPHDGDADMDGVDLHTTAVNARQSSPTDKQASPNITRLRRQTRTLSAPQTSNSDGGPRITYGKTRSYLAEDSFEDGLLMSLPSTEQQSAPAAMARTGKTAIVVSKSAFDLDYSGEDEEPGMIRSIHELRAAGRNRRVMQEMEVLLQEASNHNDRSHRQSAVLEIAGKLMVKSFVDRFVGQASEQRLIKQCMKDDDHVSCFLLAACLVCLLAVEPPEHSVRCLYDLGIADWATKMLLQSVPIDQMVKDRRYSLSKASQSEVVNFADKLAGQQHLWGDRTPSFLSSRTLSLRVLDLLIGRVRRLGDRSDLLSSEQLESILSKADNEVESQLAISILEALATTAVSPTWPRDSLDQLAQLVPNLNARSSFSRHTLFLALRLILNLTNDHASNCAVLGTEPLVGHLLSLTEDGFHTLIGVADHEQRAITLDQVVLATGIMINLAEHSELSRHRASMERGGASLVSLVSIFKQGQRRMLEAESMEESTSNVAYGYLAVLLANLCQSEHARIVVGSNLPGHNLKRLVEAVEEFVAHHQRVDTMISFEGEEGKEVWGVFTERLKSVLAKLKMVAG